MVGGYLNGADGPGTDKVEIFSPDGKCNYFLAPTPKTIVGAVLQLYNGRITVCDGSGNQVPKNKKIKLPYI